MKDIELKPRKVLIPAEYFTKSTGGNNRNWTARYRMMVDKYNMLQKLNDGSKKYKNILKGYELCLETFHYNINKDKK